MQKPKIVLGIAAALVAGTVFAETPIGEIVSQTITEHVEIILDFVEVPSDKEIEEAEFAEIISDDSEELVWEELISEEDTAILEESDKNVTVLICGEMVAIDDSLFELKEEFEIRGIEEKEVEEQLVRFATAVNEYSLNQSERDQLSLAIIEKENTDLVYETFRFLKMTPYGTEAIDDIYSMIDNEEMSIEEAYAVFSGKEEEELSVDDVAYYVANGVSTDDILALYEISLGCDVGVRTMLDRYINGENWNEIIADVYDVGNRFANLKYTLRTILYGISSARELNIPFSELAVSSTSNEIVAEQYIDEMNSKAEFVTSCKEKIALFSGYDLEDENLDSEPFFVEGKEEASIIENIYSEYNSEYNNDEILEIPVEETDFDYE